MPRRTVPPYFSSTYPLSPPSLLNIFRHPFASYRKFTDGNLKVPGRENTGSGSKHYVQGVQQSLRDFGPVGSDVVVHQADCFDRLFGDFRFESGARLKCIFAHRNRNKTVLPRSRPIFSTIQRDRVYYYVVAHAQHQLYGIFENRVMHVGRTFVIRVQRRFRKVQRNGNGAGRGSLRTIIK
jgi:hypothetical protein